MKLTDEVKDHIEQVAGMVLSKIGHDERVISYGWRHDSFGTPFNAYNVEILNAKTREFVEWRYSFEDSRVITYVGEYEYADPAFPDNLVQDYKCWFVKTELEAVCRKLERAKAKNSLCATTANSCIITANSCSSTG